MRNLRLKPRPISKIFNWTKFTLAMTSEMQWPIVRRLIRRNLRLKWEIKKPTICWLRLQKSTNTKLFLTIESLKLTLKIANLSTVWLISHDKLRQSQTSILDCPEFRLKMFCPSPRHFHKLMKGLQVKLTSLLSAKFSPSLSVLSLETKRCKV